MNFSNWVKAMGIAALLVAVGAGATVMLRPIRATPQAARSQPISPPLHHALPSLRPQHVTVRLRHTSRVLRQRCFRPNRAHAGANRVAGVG